MHATRPDLLCSELPNIENALLWAMRAWVIGHCHKKPVADRIASVFDHLGARDAADHLDAFMGAIGRGATRMLDVNCVCHPDVSADESTLLDIFALQQAERHEEAHELLGGIVVESAASAGSDSANRLVLALRDAGNDLPRRELAARRGADIVPWEAILGGPAGMFAH